MKRTIWILSVSLLALSLSCTGNSTEVEVEMTSTPLVINEKEDLIVPTVNLNGTSYRSLQEQYSEVREALRKTQNALAQMTPHGRDYQTAPPGSYELARLQHAHRTRLLDHLYQEISELAYVLLDQEK